KLLKGVNSIPTSQYMQAKKFLREMESTMDALQDPNVANLSPQRWAGKVKTIGDLVGLMTAQGLRFAPAVDGGQAAYTAVHSAMAAPPPGPDPRTPGAPSPKKFPGPPIFPARPTRGGGGGFPPPPPLFRSRSRQTSGPRLPELWRVPLRFPVTSTP